MTMEPYDLDALLSDRDSQSRSEYVDVLKVLGAGEVERETDSEVDDGEKDTALPKSAARATADGAYREGDEHSSSAEDEAVAFSQSRRRSRVTFVGLSDEEDDSGVASSSDSDEEQHSSDDEDAKPEAVDEDDEVLDQRPLMPSEAPRASAGGRTGGDSRFVVARGTSLTSNSDTARRDVNGSDLGPLSAPSAVSATRSTHSHNHHHHHHVHALQRQRRSALQSMSTNEVHKTFQRHWDLQEKRRFAFQLFSEVGLADDDPLADRHRRLVNESNWDGNHAEDILLPPSLLHVTPTSTASPSDAPIANISVPTLRPHQVDGIRFMWRCLMEGPLDSVPAVGCILAHSMGLGKSAQVVILLHLIQRAHQRRMRLAAAPKAANVQNPRVVTDDGVATIGSETPLLRMVLVAPKSVLASWESEFNKWSVFFPPAERLSLVVMDDRMPRDQRVEAFEDLFRRGGVVLLGYEALVFLEREIVRREVVHSHTTGGVDDGGGGSGTTHAASTTSLAPVSVAEDRPFQFGSSVDLLVCDEGHRLKSSNLDTAKALARLHASRRLVLTGTPMQNHLLEYWAMADFALPKFFDRKSFLNYFVKPIQKAADANATEAEVANAKKKTFILVQEFSKFMQRVDNEPLRAELPPLHEVVVSVPLSPLQYRLYAKFIDVIRKQHGTKFNVLQAFSYASKICAHPKLLYDAGEVNAATAGPYADLLQPEERYTLESADGLKLDVAVRLIRAAAAQGEKSIVFSMSTKLLDLLEELIRKSDFAERNSNSGNRKRAREPTAASDEAAAAEGAEEATSVAMPTKPSAIRFLRIDGSSTAGERERRIREFQTKSAKYDCFLLSTKAGGVGITITAATRVILLDCSFNPADDRQAIGRAYRYGQTKPVFVYRLVCRHTIEHHIFNQKIAKEWMFETVVNDRNIKRDSLSGVRLRQIFLMRDARPISSDEGAQHMIPERARLETEERMRVDTVLASVRQWICSAVPHDSYLEVDADAQYGAEEADSYQRYRQGGGLRQVTEESAEQRVRLNREAAEQWRNVQTQSLTLTAMIQSLIQTRSDASPRVREFLRHMGVFSEIVDRKHQETRGTSLRPELATLLHQHRALPQLLVDKDEGDGDDDDVIHVDSHGDRVVAEAAGVGRRSLVRPLVDASVYAPHRPGASKDTAVELDD